MQQKPATKVIFKKIDIPLDTELINGYIQTTQVINVTHEKKLIK
jgi:hypothetical protein